MKNTKWHKQKISPERRAALKGQEPAVVWITGLSGSGKSSLANALDVALYEWGYHSLVLDGDNLRHGLNSDLGFSEQERMENIRRVGEVAKLFASTGEIVIAALISPYQESREMVRQCLQPGQFFEIYLNTPLSTCEKRDPKGLYQKARQGLIENFTGLDGVYEAPSNAELVLDTSTLSVEECVDEVFKLLRHAKVLKEPTPAPAVMGQ